MVKNNAGYNLLILEIKKFFIEKKSLRNILVIKKPLITKKISTPIKPFLKILFKDGWSI